MSKKELAVVTSTRITVIGTIIVAVIGLISALVLGYWQFVLKPSGSNQAIETQYIGRVIDVNTQQTIAGAKITLDLEGVPPIVYTDSEGVYRFKVVIETDISGQIRVDAQGYQVYTRNISLSPQRTNIEDIRLTPQSSILPAETAILSAFTESFPLFPTTPDELRQIAIVDVEASKGSLVPVGSTSCLWTEASGRGASIVANLEEESTIVKLRIALFGNFVRKVSLKFSDGSQQTKDFIVIKDYEYQDVVLEPVRTSRITVEVLEVEDNFASDFGICHIEVFGSTP